MTGSLVQRPTSFRKHIRTEVARANRLRAEWAKKETMKGQTGHPWLEWVPDWLEVRHCDSPKTLRRKLDILTTFVEYFSSINVSCPEQVTREHCINYVKWRKSKGHMLSSKKKPIHHNTILLEIKVLSNILLESVHRGYIETSPCQRLGIKRVAPRMKSELSSEQIEFVRAEISRMQRTAKDKDEDERAQFFHFSFEFALMQGCRLSETYLPIRDIDMDNGLVTFREKGGKFHVSALNPKAVPLIQDLKRQGAETTYKQPRMASLLWFKFFDRIRRTRPDFNNVSFHSTRVTWISAAERSGAPEHLVMRQVNHTSTTVHRIYRRVHSSEMNPWWDAVSFPARPSEPETQDSSPPSPPIL